MILSLFSLWIEPILAEFWYFHHCQGGQNPSWVLCPDNSSTMLKQSKYCTEHRRKLKVIGFWLVIWVRIVCSTANIDNEIHVWICTKISNFRPKGHSFYMLFVTQSHGFWENTHIDVGTSRTYKIVTYCPVNTSYRRKQALDRHTHML
jgi:hypothetical protein